MKRTTHQPQGGPVPYNASFCESKQIFAIKQQTCLMRLKQSFATSLTAGLCLMRQKRACRKTADSTQFLASSLTFIGSIRFTEQAGFLTYGSSRLPPSHIFADTMASDIRSPNTVTGSLRTRTWFPLQTICVCRLFGIIHKIVCTCTGIFSCYWLT